MTPKRATREFAAKEDVWKVADAWAKRQGYRVVEESGDHRLYRKGAGIMVGSRMLDVRRTGDKVHLEAWVAANLAARAMSLFILPAEMTIESGGAKGIVPRRLGRGEVNELLQELGQEPVS